MLNTATVALFLLLQGTGNPAQQTPKGSIEGIVLQSVTGESLDRARLTLNRLAPVQTGPTNAPITPPPPILPVQTEKDGKFIFKDLDAGQYRLSVQRNGYAGQQYGQRTATSAGTVINLTEGQQLKDIAFRLIPAATIAGRVRDSNGEPVPGFQVSLLRSIYNVNGQRSLSNVGTATTDDRGEYRIFWVAPGRYVLSVGGNSGLVSFISSDGSGQIIRTGGSSSFADRIFPLTYYPGTLDPSRATVIELQPGAELSAMDVVLTQPVTYRIRGKVVDATTGKPPSSAGVSIIPRQDSSASGNIIVTTQTSATVNYNNATGIFEIRNVIPGSYWLRSSSSTDLNEPINLNVAGTARTAMELLDSVMLNTSRYAQF
ncbi:MAG TPA: carboxypeptidase-like regulatory domain-containing protein, partial [Terriglobia bacterium]|nr:carboxypeptidase-like regulatory domain-containing protein [Terriglobia bacterium]